jgi:hypothetical protein
LSKRIQESKESTLINLPHTGNQRSEKSLLEDVMSSPVTKTIGRELVRGIFGMFFGAKSRR